MRERLSRRSEIERDLVAASAAQAHAVPRALPGVAGFESSALTLPARGVGGDFFLGQRIGPDRLVVALGDVSGKGMPAGLVASSLQARVETVARHAAGSAGDIIADVNRDRCATIGRRAIRHARLSGSRYHDAYASTVVNAGHLPAIVTRAWRRAGVSRVDRAGARHPSEAAFGSHTLHLAPGAAIVLYSDGVTEACDQHGEEFGDERLVNVITTHASDSRRAPVPGGARRAAAASVVTRRRQTM